MENRKLVQIKGANNIVLVTSRENWDAARKAVSSPQETPAALLFSNWQSFPRTGLLEEVPFFTAGDAVRLGGLWEIGQAGSILTITGVYEGLRLLRLATVREAASICGLHLERSLPQ